MKTLRIFTILALVFASPAFAQTYLGYITSDVNIVDSTGEKVTKKSRKGDGILIYTLDLYGKDNYKVHHINGNRDGFLSRKNILLVKSVPYLAMTQEEIKQAIIDSEMKMPLLKLYNNTKGKLSLKFGNEKIVLKPQERMELKMNKGKYYYKLAIEGQEAYYGVEVLAEHKMYDWEFYLGK